MSQLMLLFKNTNSIGRIKYLRGLTKMAIFIDKQASALTFSLFSDAKK